MSERPPGVSRAGVDYAELYDHHPEYAARRRADSIERAQINLEVRAYKLPNLLAVWGQQPPQRLIEIGCATGELLSVFPVAAHGLRCGVDISERNVVAAADRFPGIQFRVGDFRALDLPQFDLVLLSDVLEHVPDAPTFLAAASALGRQVLVNLPLENNWLNCRRRYGPDDVSGHLRSYSLAQGLALFESAGLRVKAWQQVWFHETPAAAERRVLRISRHGHAFGGSLPVRCVKHGLFELAAAVRPLGRSLFASNLFALAMPAVGHDSP